MLLFGWLVPSPSMQAFDAVIYAHLLPGAFAISGAFPRRGWGGVGRRDCRLRIHPRRVGLGAAAAHGMIFSYGYFPLALYLLEEALARRSYRYGLGFAMVAALMTVGRDQVAFLFALTLIGYAVYVTVSAERPLAFARQRLGRTRHHDGGRRGAARRPDDPDDAVACDLDPPRGSATGSPPWVRSRPRASHHPLGDIFGSLRWTYDYWGPDWHTIPEGTSTDRATNYLFAGTVPALLLMWHGIAGRRLFAREFRFFLISEWWRSSTPSVAIPRSSRRCSTTCRGQLYRRPADATFLINVALAFAAGYLVHRYVAEGAPRLVARRAGAVLAAVAALGLVGAAALGMVYAVRANQVPAAARDMALGLVLASGAAWLLVRGSAATAHRAAVAMALVAVAGGELIWRNAASSLNAEPQERYAVFQTLPPEQLQGLNILKDELASRQAKGERPRVEILGLGGAWQNASMVLGLEDTLGYNPLRLADYEKAVGPGENAVDMNLRTFPALFRGYKCRLAGLLGLEYLVLDRPGGAPAAALPAGERRQAPLRLGPDVDLSPRPRHAARVRRQPPGARRLRGRAVPGRAAGVRAHDGGAHR
jgi:hypothetical protein